MLNSVTHSAAIAATTAGIAAFVFDVPPPVVFAAFSGACFAVALSEKMTYKAALCNIFGSTFASTMVTPEAMHLFNAASQRGVAAILAFCLIFFRKDIFSFVRGKFKPPRDGDT